MKYSKNAYEEAMEAKDAAICMENAIKDFIKESSNNTSEEGVSIDNDRPIKYSRKQAFWYTVSDDH